MLSKIFLKTLKCVAQAHTTGKLTRSKNFRQVQHQCYRSLNLSIPSKVSHTMRSASFRPSVASQSTRYFCCHLKNLWSTQRIIVGSNAIDLSLMTLFGIRKNKVVQACCGHLPHCSTCSKNSTFPLSNPTELGMKAITSHSRLCLATHRCPLQLPFQWSRQILLKTHQLLISPRLVL